METKNIVIIAILLIIISIIVGFMFGMITKNDEGYDRIELTSNGTTIEVPAQAEYMGDTDGIRFWNWSGGE